MPHPWWGICICTPNLVCYSLMLDYLSRGRLVNQGDTLLTVASKWPDFRVIFTSHPG
jgi:hypothetical protein